MVQQVIGNLEQEKQKCILVLRRVLFYTSWVINSITESISQHH